MVSLVLSNTASGGAVFLSVGTAGLFTVIVAAAAAGYIATLAMHPNVKCVRCKGAGRHRGAIFAYATRPCTVCKGRGITPRLGRKVFFKDYEAVAARTEDTPEHRLLLALADLMAAPHERRLGNRRLRAPALSESPPEEHPQLISSFLRGTPRMLWHGWYVQIFHPAKAVSGKGASHGDDHE